MNNEQSSIDHAQQAIQEKDKLLEEKDKLLEQKDKLLDQLIEINDFLCKQMEEYKSKLNKLEKQMDEIRGNTSSESNSPPPSSK